MTKANAMDRLIGDCASPIGSADVFDCVNEVFDIDLRTIPALSGAREGAAAVDGFLEQCCGRATGAEIRQAINEIYGVNLDALSALDGKHISLYSKGQWVLRRRHDLFAVHTGAGDVDVTITSTPHYRGLAGTERLPGELTDALTGLGFRCDAEGANCSFVNPTGEAVPDAFKGETIMAVLSAISRMKTEI